MKARKGVLLGVFLVLLLLLYGTAGPAGAQGIPTPTNLTADLKVDGVRILGIQPQYSIKVFDPTSGNSFLPIDQPGSTFGGAVDTGGNPKPDIFNYNIPMYEPDNQPDGAALSTKAGKDPVKNPEVLSYGCIQIFEKVNNVDYPLPILSPARGVCPFGAAQITMPFATGGFITLTGDNAISTTHLTVTANSGNEQSGSIGTALASPIVAKLQDYQGNGISDTPGTPRKRRRHSALAWPYALPSHAYTLGMSVLPRAQRAPAVLLESPPTPPASSWRGIPALPRSSP